MVKGYTKLESLKSLGTSYGTPDRRWAGNVVPPSQTEKRFKVKLERQYKEDLEHKVGFYEIQ